MLGITLLDQVIRRQTKVYNVGDTPQVELSIWLSPRMADGARLSPSGDQEWVEQTRAGQMLVRLAISKESRETPG